MDNPLRRIAFVQFGDYADAFKRLDAGGSERYFAQRHSVESVGELAKSSDVCVVTVARDRPKLILGNGVITCGVDLFASKPARYKALYGLLDDFAPTHLVLLSPLEKVLRWALHRNIRVLPMFADSFGSLPLRRRYRYARLRQLLNRTEVAWVGNHNLNASYSLAGIGVRPDKIIPWDWPIPVSAQELKNHPSGRAWTLLFVGSLVVTKGVGDCIEAVSILQERRLAANLVVVGDGPYREVAAQHADHLGVQEGVEFRGALAHEDVLAQMRIADVVIVPSRHEYPEGLPMTIYEALLANTPLCVSDHPMFVGRIRDGKDGLVFQAGNGASLANAVCRLYRDAALYESLSRNSQQSLERIAGSVEHYEVIRRWLEESAEADHWLSLQTLGNNRHK